MLFINFLRIFYIIIIIFFKINIIIIIKKKKISCLLIFIKILEATFSIIQLQEIHFRKCGFLNYYKKCNFPKCNTHISIFFFFFFFFFFFLKNKLIKRKSHN